MGAVKKSEGTSNAQKRRGKASEQTSKKPLSIRLTDEQLEFLEDLEKTFPSTTSYLVRMAIDYFIAEVRTHGLGHVVGKIHKNNTNNLSRGG